MLSGSSIEPAEQRTLKNELRKERERDRKLGLVIYFSTTIISDQIKPH